jgi:hypothetical protein
VIKLRRMRLARLEARMLEMINAYKMLVAKPEGKRPRGGPRRRWGEDIGNGSLGDTVDRCGMDASDSGLGTVAASCGHGCEALGSLVVLS